MNIRNVVHTLAVVGVLFSVIYLIKMHATVGYTAFLSVWLLVPYLLLAWINEAAVELIKYPMESLLWVIGILVMAAVFMLDTAVFHPDPLGEIAMLFLPPLQALCLARIWKLNVSKNIGHAER